MALMQKQEMKSWAGVTLAAALFFFSCDRPAEHQSIAPAVASQTSRRFVAFRQPALMMASLETATEPPVAVGSTPAADLLSSSDPAVVSIDPAGNLVAHKNGTAVIHGSGGAALEVTVNAVQRLEIRPSRLNLASGKNAVVQVTGDGRVLPLSSYRWETTNPNTAAASGAMVYAGFTPGTATLTLRSGNATATLDVNVSEPNFRMEVQGPNAPKLGAVERFTADAPLGLPLQWTSSNGKVLEPLRDGAFYAHARGLAEVCAAAGSRRACKRVAVR